jgi:hypothetical protein
MIIGQKNSRANFFFSVKHSHGCTGSYINRRLAQFENLRGNG